MLYGKVSTQKYKSKSQAEQQFSAHLLSRDMEGARYIIASSKRDVPLRTILLSDISSTGSPATDEYRAHLTSGKNNNNNKKNETRYYTYQTSNKLLQQGIEYRK